MSIKTPNEYEFVVEDLSDLVCTHRGSVDLQAELEWDTLFLPSLLLQSITDKLADACKDTYGNYVIQKLLPLLSNSQICYFIQSISSGFISIAVSVPGSCVLGCLIEECAKRELESQLMPLFNSNLVLLAQSQHGSHVLQVLIRKFPKRHLTLLFEFVQRNFLNLAKDRYGCCLIKKVVEKDSSILLECILADLNELCTVKEGDFTLKLMLNPLRINIVITLYSITLI